MNEIELELKQLMADRAGTVDAMPEMRRTLRRTRVRRTANAGIGILTIVALATVSVAGVRAFTRPDTTRPDLASPGYTTGGEYGFASVYGRYPTVASGEFRGTEWELTTETVTEFGVDSVRLELHIGDGGTDHIVGLDIHATDDVMINKHVRAGELFDGADVLFGATVRGIESVDVAVADGDQTVVEPHRFIGYDTQSSITVDMYIAFVPADSPGFLHARNELGIDVDLEAYGGVSLAPHVVATGKVPTSGASWSLEFAAVQPDRACVVFSFGEPESQCFDHEQLANARPLLMFTAEKDDVLVVVAVLSDQVGSVQIEVDGKVVDLPWFQPEQEDLGEWPIRMVAVGLEPGTHGTLQATLGDSDILAEERF